MSEYYWFVLAGALLIGVVLASVSLRRLPVSTAIIYLGVGMLLGPGAAGMVSLDLLGESTFFEHLTEIAVIVSLFTAGLNWRTSLRPSAWSAPVRLATLTMMISIAAMTMAGVYLLGFSLGAAVLLGAVLAPTDPVLASEVQVRDSSDRDQVRHGLTGEAGLNDGLAFPFVMLGLGILELHPDDEAGFLHLWAGADFSLWGWLGWDVVWAVTTGVAVGALTGGLLGRLAIHLYRRRQIAALPEFFVLGVIAFSYGLAEIVYGYGFLAVFAAGYALRRIELLQTGYAEEPPDLTAEDHEEPGVDAGRAAERMVSSLLSFNVQLERILEAGVVVLVGTILVRYLSLEALWLAPLLFLAVRPLAVAAGLAGVRVAPPRKALIGWFGIRGIGSIFYLSYAISSGLPDATADRLASLVLPLVAISIVVHSISVTPIMDRYEKMRE